MLASSSSATGARYSLTELFVLHFAPYAPKLAFAAEPPKQISALSTENLHYSVLKNFEETLSLLDQHKFVPSSRLVDFAAALIGETAITAVRLENLCRVSNDTATRWLNKAVEADLLRRIKVGKRFVYINLLHFALIQDLPIPLSSIPAATGLKANQSSRIQFANPLKYLDSYPAKYLQSIRPPF